MSKGYRPDGPRPPRPPAERPKGGGPPGSPPDACAVEIDLAAHLEFPVPIGTAVVALVSGPDVVLQSGGQRVGLVPSPDNAVVRICATKGWTYQGFLLTDGPDATVRLAGART